MNKFLRNWAEVNVIYYNFKLGDACKTSLESGINKEICSHVVYFFSCALDEAISYIGHTTRLLKTRILEHKRLSSNIGKHVNHCFTCNLNFSDRFKIMDRDFNQNKLKIK